MRRRYPWPHAARGRRRMRRRAAGACAGSYYLTRAGGGCLVELDDARRAAELLERAALDLAGALARHADLLADAVERHAVAALEAEAELQHALVALRQPVERAADVLAPHDVRDPLVPGLAGVVLDHVAEVGRAVLRQRLVERHRQPGPQLDLGDVRLLPLERPGELLRRRLAAHALDELALHRRDLVGLLEHVDRHANGARLVGDRARDALAGPPRRVGRDLRAESAG